MRGKAFFCIWGYKLLEMVEASEFPISLIAQINNIIDVTVKEMLNLLDSDCLSFIICGDEYALN